MEKQAFRPYSCSFFAAKTQAPTKVAVPLSMVKSMKRKNHHNNPEQQIEHEEFQSKSKKPRTSETSSSKSSPTKKEGLLSFVNAIVASNVTTDSEREVFWTKKNHSQEEVSTKLTLFDESWYSKNRKLMEDSGYHYSASILTTEKTLSRDASEAELNQKVVACKIAAMKFYTPREEEEERRMGVSTKLKLYEDPFKIRKKLTGSDLGHMCRLLLSSSSVKNHVFPFFSINRVNNVESDKGTRVMIWDQDTSSEHTLLFKRWPTSKSYVFIGKWKKDFVNRRGLKEGDEIGLYWDIYSSRFTFSVLKRVPRNQLVVN